MKSIGLIVFDFDGVFTDNKVYLSEEGVELVRCDRSDGLGVDYLRQAGIRMMVLSTERNPVVARRCEKLRLECIHGVDEKLSRLGDYLGKIGVGWGDVAYVGNDLNDESCMRKVGMSVAPADAHERIRELADVVLTRKGGDGAVREFAEILLKI